jgi:TonB family protein
VVDAAPAEPRPSAAPAIPPSELESLLTIGRSRLAQGRVLTADGDGARAYLDRAAALAPDADGVVSLRAGVAAAMVGEARLALAAGDLGRAERLFADASELGAEPETLALLNLDLEAAREARADAEARALLEDAVAAIGAGRLIEPTGDNALESLTALRSQAADTPGLAAAWADLLGALTRNAERAIGAQDWDAAERWIGAIRSAEAGAPGLAELEGELQAAQLQAAYLANPASVGELVLRTQGTVLYPEDAQRREIEGWVDLAYVVGTDGVPKDIRVLEANPAEWFEDAAVESVSQYRYVPFELDGRRYERLAHMRIRFNLQ